MEDETQQISNGNKEEKVETIAEFDGMPQEYREVITPALLERYIEVLGNDNIHEHLEAYKYKFNTLNSNEQKKLVQSLRDNSIKSMDKLKKILNEGAEYYNGSTYGRIHKAGGEYAYIKQLEEENKQYRSQIERSQAERSKMSGTSQREERRRVGVPTDTIDTFDDDVYGTVNEMRHFFSNKRRERR